MRKLAMVGYISLMTLLLGGCSTRVSPGYVGIQVNYSGTGRGVADYPVVTGRVWYNPWNTTILEYPTFVQNAVWTRSTTEGKAVNEEITFTNKDQMQIAADISVGYQLISDKVPAFYVKFRSDDLDTFTNGFMRNMAREKFDEAAGKFTVEQIMGDNAVFLKEVRDNLQKELDPIGVKIVQFGLIGAPRPPQAVIDAINAKVHATQLAQQKQNELIQVQADAAKNVAEATGDAQATLTRANAQAQANIVLSKSLTPELVQLKLIEKWQGNLPQVNGGSANPFISLQPNAASTAK